MTDITNTADNSNNDSTKIPGKRGRKKGVELGARAASVSLAAVIDGKLVFENYKSELFNDLPSSEGKKIVNSDILQGAVDWFKAKHGIAPQQMSEPYYTRFSLGAQAASATVGSCPYDMSNIDFKHGSKLGVYKQWKVSYREIEQDKNWVYIAKAISRESSDEKASAKPGVKLVHISEIVELAAAE